MPTQDFLAVFEQLKAFIKPFEPYLLVKTDRPASYYLTASFVTQFGKEIDFGGVEIKKNYVSFHLMPVYARPELLETMSAPLMDESFKDGRIYGRSIVLHEVSFKERGV